MHWNLRPYVVEFMKNVLNSLYYCNLCVYEVSANGIQEVFFHELGVDQSSIMLTVYIWSHV